jgi:prevent-host-death family protein
LHPTHLPATVPPAPLRSGDGISAAKWAGECGVMRTEKEIDSTGKTLYNKINGSINMSTRNIDINDAKDKFQEIVLQAEQGDEIIITKNNKPIVKISPLQEKKFHRKAGSAKGMIKMSDDFNEPLEEFKEYME